MSKKKVKEVKLLVLGNSVTYDIPLGYDLITNETFEDAFEEAQECADNYDQHGEKVIVIKKSDCKKAIKGIEELSGKKLFTIDQICKIWEEVYGEKMKSEYRGFIKLLRERE